MECESAGAVRCDSHDNCLGGMRREDLARESDVADPVLDTHDAGVEIERAPILRRRVAMFEIEEQVAEGLIRRRSGAGVDHHVAAGRGLGFRVLPLEQELANFGQGFERLRRVERLGMSRPEAMFVELEALMLDSAEDHCAEVPIADRHRLALPFGGRAPIPERQRVCGSRFLRGGGDSGERESDPLDQFPAGRFSHGGLEGGGIWRRGGDSNPR